MTTKVGLEWLYSNSPFANLKTAVLSQLNLVNIIGKRRQ
jgi:hypothetical protein